MVLNVVRSARFLWNATRGSRLRPWRSEYLRWRMETYTGKPAGTLRLKDFTDLMMNEHRQFLRFLVWTTEMQAIARGAESEGRK
jgi:hypothetical protein